MITIDPDQLRDEIAGLMFRVGQHELVPRLAGAADTVRMKSPGEVVTEADVAAEDALALGLAMLTPNVEVLGEESAAEEPELLRRFGRCDAVWIVDPLDGTKHFAQGEGPFGVMVALMCRGVCEGAWIHMPLTGESAYARRGGGAFLNGERVTIPPPPAPSELRGGLLTRFVPEPLRTRAESTQDFTRTEGQHWCAARRYLDMLTGAEHFALYWRTLPWDHAPGALLVQEAGGVARRVDGSAFDAADVDATSLLVASDEPTWSLVRERVLGMTDATPRS